MKMKPLVPKKLKYKPITAKPLKYLKIAVDKDGDGIPQFLDCNDRSAKESGVLHDWLNKQRLLQERKNMAKLDIEPLKEEQEHFDKELSKAETGIEHFKGQIEEMTGEMKGNIREGLKGTDKNFGRVAKDYTKRAEQTRRTPSVQQHPGGRAVHYLIPAWVACRKMYADPDTGEPISVPRFKRDKYVPFSPPVVGSGGAFHPHQAPLPRYLLMRKLRRLMLYYSQTGQYDKLRQLQIDLQGGQK